MLEEGLQGLADRVPLLDGQQVLQLLAEGPSVDFDAWRKNLCHPLQRAEGRRPVKWEISIILTWIDYYQYCFSFFLRYQQMLFTEGSHVSLFVHIKLKKSDVF